MSMVERVQFYFVDHYGEADDNEVFTAEVDKGSTIGEVYNKIKSQISEAGQQFKPIKDVSFTLYEDKQKVVIPADVLVQEFINQAEDSELKIAVLSIDKGTVLELDIGGRRTVRLRDDQFQTLEKALNVFNQMQDVMKSKNYGYIRVNNKEISSQQLSWTLKYISQIRGSRKLVVQVIGRKELSSSQSGSDRQQSKPQIKPDSLAPPGQPKMQVKEIASASNPLLKPKPKVELKQPSLKPKVDLQQKGVVQSKGGNQQITFYIQFYTSAGKGQEITYDTTLDRKWDDVIPHMLKQMMNSGFPWDEDWDYRNEDQLTIEYNHRNLGRKELQQRISSSFTDSKGLFYLKFSMRYLGG